MVEQRSRVGEDDALDGGVGDVPFVPQRDVLECGLSVAAQHAREPRHLFGLDRVALVGHRAGTLLTLRERFAHFAHFGASEVPELGRKPLQPSACKRDRLKPRRALSVDGGAGDRDGKTGAKQSLTRDVRPRRTLLHGASHHDVLDERGARIGGAKNWISPSNT